MNPGLLGGLLLPILGAFPDSILILVSGVGGTVQQVTSLFLHLILLLNVLCNLCAYAECPYYVKTII